MLQTPPPQLQSLKPPASIQGKPRSVLLRWCYVFQPVSARPGAQCSGRITLHVAPPEGSCNSLSTCLQDGRPGVPIPPACTAGPLPA
jgi:hypothetical protein